MRTLFLTVSLTLAVVASLPCQGTGFVTQSRVVGNLGTIHAPEGSTVSASDDGEGDYWVSEDNNGCVIAGGAAETLGDGCTKLNRTGTILGSSDDAGLPTQLVAETGDSSAGFVYYGLSADGASWVPSATFASRGVPIFTDPYTLLRDPDTDDLHLFNACCEEWIRLPGVGPPGVVGGSTALVVQQGTSLHGFSECRGPATLKGLVRVPAYVPGTGDPSRGLLSYRTGPARLHVFATYPVDWTRVQLVNPNGFNGLVVHEYGANVLLIGDGDSLAKFVSGFTGNVTTRTVQNLGSYIQNGDYRVEGSVALLADRATGTAWAYRAIDDSVHVATSLQLPTQDRIVSDDDWVGFRRGVRIELISGSRSGSWATIDLLGQNELGEAQDRTNLIVVTDKAVHAYSSLLGQWTSTTYSGNFASVTSEDFVAYVRTSTEVVAFSPRTGAFARVNVPKTATVAHDESIVLVRDGTTRHAFGANSVAFHKLSLRRAPVLERVAAEYALAIGAVPLGGSEFSAFCASADRWFEDTSKETFDPRKPAVFAKRHAVIRVGPTLARVSGYSDLSSCRGWPAGSRLALRARAGSGQAPFVAEGPANAAHSLVIGVDRLAKPLAIPGVTGKLQVDPGGAVFVVVPTGALGADGRIRFELPLPGGVLADLVMQSVLLAPGPSVLIGQPLLFFVH